MKKKKKRMKKEERKKEAVENYYVRLLIYEPSPSQSSQSDSWDSESDFLMGLIIESIPI